MFEGLFKLKYVNFKTSFVYLSPGHVQVNTGNYLQLSYQDIETKATRKAFFSVTILNSLELEEIGINSVCANALNISEKTYIHVYLIDHLPVINSLSIKPKNQNDYEVLEILAKNVQSSLLDQVRVVNIHQPLVIWIGNSISVTVLVEDVRPISPGILDFLTELTILTPHNLPVASTSASTSKRAKLIENPPGEMKEKFVKYITENPHKTKIEDIYSFLFSNQGSLFRVVPLYKIPRKCLSKEKILKIVNTSTVFVMRQIKDFAKGAMFTLTALNSSHSRQTVYVKVAFLKQEGSNCQNVYKENKYNIFVPSGILNSLDLDLGSRVILKKVETPNPLVFEIEIRSKKNHLYNVVEKFKTFVQEHIEHEPLLLNANLPMNIADNLCVSLKFLPDSSEFSVPAIINKDVLKNCKFTLVEDDTINMVTDKEEKEDLCDSQPAGVCLAVLRKFLFAIIGDSVTNTIVVGKAGSGKTTFLKLLAEFSEKRPCSHWYSEVLYCKQLKGKTVESLQKIFSDVAQKLVSCQPSALFLDDLQVLCKRCEGDESPNSVYYNRVSEMLQNMFIQMTTNNAVFIVASGESIDKWNRHIYSTRGNNLFKKVVSIEGLNKSDREYILKYYFQKRKTENLDFNNLATRTDGFVMQDLVDFYIKAVYEAHKQEKDPKKLPVVTREHCEIALQKTTPISLQNVKFSDARYKSFSDIGGLQDVKSVLIESLMWPSQYSQIFSNSPLRLQSGILLYGAPGTGKTLLAGAAAKYCDLRLISVKGPELLGKYIGASEQAVRDIFEKAQNAKPCILFFDEFDSLAPRRGHDNTGVTDRVVNQLLTHLDGIESLTDVFVLAATSRPDLLDPALLRPGRLDKQLFCDLPNEEERVEILKILSKGLDLDDDVDFQRVSRITEGFTGADLQSLMYTAQMSIVTDMEVDRSDVRDEKLSRMKARFCPDTPKHFLPRRAKEQLLEQANSELLAEYRHKSGLLIFVILENQEMRMITVKLHRSKEAREILTQNDIAVEADTRIEIYDFNNWAPHEPHYAVFVGNCNPDLVSIPLFTCFCVLLALAQEEDNPILNPNFFYAFPKGYTPLCASKGLTYCENIETDQYPGELIYVLLKMSKLNYTKILREEQIIEDEVPTSMATVKYCHKFDKDDEYCAAEEHEKIRYFGKRSGPKNNSQQENAKKVWLDLLANFEPKRHHIYKRQATKKPDRKRQLTVKKRVVPLCGSRSNYVRPMTAMNRNSEWMWIVNMHHVSTQMTQLVKTVVCLPKMKDRPCSNCDTPFGYTTICKQKYAQKRLLALEPSGTDLVLDSFWVPVGCHCMRMRKKTFF